MGCLREEGCGEETGGVVHMRPAGPVTENLIFQRAWFPYALRSR